MATKGEPARNPHSEPQRSAEQAQEPSVHEWQIRHLETAIRSCEQHDALHLGYPLVRTKYVRVYTRIKQVGMTYNHAAQAVANKHDAFKATDIIPLRP